MNMNYMILKKLELGDLPLENISVGCTSGSAFTQMHGSRPSGLLGANILKRFLVTIDFEQRKIILADPDNVKIPADAAVIPTKPAMGSLGVIIDGVIDNKLSIPFLVDTGAAFDNLSSSLVQPLLHDEKLLPVSKILGLDGQQVDVGAIQFRTLKLGDFVVDKPVFSIASTPAGSTGAGIITSKTIGILGNPLWSRFKLTIDYRHNRIFLEKSKQEAAINAITQRLDKIKMQLHVDKDYKKAHAGYDKLLQSQGADQLASRALIVAERGAATVDEAEAQHDQDLLVAAKNDFDSANDLASKCKNTAVTARVFAKLARHMAAADPALGPMTRVLVSRAVALAPMDAEVLTSAAMVMKASNLALAQKVVDQALSADPTNWDALWLRYQLCDSMNEPQDKPLVEAQLRRYYANAPEVVALNHQAEIGKQPGSSKKSSQAAAAQKNGNKKTN
ncbi:MAG TPA: retropepsin-like aspartic protease, partial [Trichormus sp.]